MTSEYPEVPALHECSPRGGERVFALLGDMVFPDGRIAKKYFKTDGCSRPAWLKDLISKYDQYLPAYIGHDRDYAEQDMSRREADLLLFLALSDAGMSDRKAKTIYYTLRMFGWVAWWANKLRPRDYFYMSQPEIDEMEQQARMYVWSTNDKINK